MTRGNIALAGLTAAGFSEPDAGDVVGQTARDRRGAVIRGIGVPEGATIGDGGTHTLSWRRTCRSQSP